MTNDLFQATFKDSTPMMGQYLRVKAQYPDCLLLFRMGDFFELFFEDAKKASAILNIALTHRGKYQNEDVPMCGIPAAALDNYVGRLVRHGSRVVICDQVEHPEDARKRGNKAVIRREVTRIVTAGTLLEDGLLSSKRNNFLMAIVPRMNKKNTEIQSVSFATIDISTGDFFVNTVVSSEFSSILDLYHPKEIILSSAFEKTDFIKNLQNIDWLSVTILPAAKFNPNMEKDRLEKYFKVKTLDSFGISPGDEIAACGAVVEYLKITQCNDLSSLPIPKKQSLSNYLIIDPNTGKSLEIVSSIHGEYEYCLLGAIDNTKTAFGARLLASRVAMPIVDIDLLNARLDCIDFFIHNEKMRKLIRDALSNCPDFERAINRIKFNKFSCRDVGDIRTALQTVDIIKNIIADQIPPTEDEYAYARLKDLTHLRNQLQEALVETLPAGNHNMIAPGYSKELDDLQYVKNHSEELIIDLQEKYIHQTGINTLRIKNNSAIGWFIEIPLSQRNKIPDNFVHRQTLLNNIRYITDELIILQTKLDEAYEKWSNLETELYLELIKSIMHDYESILYAIKYLAVLDVYTSLAQIAVDRNYVRPTICTDPVFEVENGRHPILDVHVSDFTPNSCNLTNVSKVCLLTGPNMAGKSTYLRQNALLIILAQVGCFVPAEKARIGIVDRLFSRIGASDDIARGRSTFMVEMIETATILNQATHQSFVILDEVGRGTSTYDGLAIAWAVVEQLYNVNQCRVLFATHYRELTALQKELKHMQCKTLKVQEWNSQVIFYHKIIDGIADKSYGIHVASLAGVPQKVIARANLLLKNLEKNDHSELVNMDAAIQLDFKYDSLQQKLNRIDINNTTPLQALSILQELKNGNVI